MLSARLAVVAMDSDSALAELEAVIGGGSPCADDDPFAEMERMAMPPAAAPQPAAQPVAQPAHSAAPPLPEGWSMHGSTQYPGSSTLQRPLNLTWPHCQGLVSC